jgi:hypothetical protein
VEGVEPLGSDPIAFFGASAVPTSRDGDVVRVRMPPTGRDQIVLTILLPTPELSVAYAYWYPVGSG